MEENCCCLVASLGLTLLPPSWTLALQAPPRDFPSKHTRVGCHFLLQEIFSTQGSDPCLPHCKQVLYCWATREAQSKISPRLNAALSPYYKSEKQDQKDEMVSSDCIAFPEHTLRIPGVEPRSPALQAESLPSEPQGKPKNIYSNTKIFSTQWGSIGETLAGLAVALAF